MSIALLINFTILQAYVQLLLQILGSGMSNRMWENTVEHAKTCVLGTKLFVYYTDETNSTGIMFNNIYELRGLIADGHFFSLESLTPNQKVNFLSVYQFGIMFRFDMSSTKISRMTIYLKLRKP